MEIENSLICFLELKISVVGKKLTTTVFYKIKDSHSYLPNNSYHKTLSIKSIQIGPVLRVSVFCSIDYD